MSLLGFVLVLAAAICHATWNYFVKRINAGPELVWLFSAVALVIYLPLAIWFALGWTGFGLHQALFILGSNVIHLVYFLLLQMGYRRGDLSLVYPVARATGPLVSTVLAVVFLGEVLSPGVALGGGVVVFGVLMLTGGLNGRARNAAISLAFGLGAGLLIGSYTAWDAYAVSALMVPPLILDYASSAFRVVALAPVAWRRRERVCALWAGHRAGVVAIAVFSPLAYILVLFALTFTPVIYVAPLRELSVLLTVLLGTVLLGEGHLRQRLVWATVILAGVAILATSS